MKPQKYIKCSRRFADVWGLDVAVVMEQVKYWLTRNSEKPECHHEGTIWFFGSIRYFTENYFPYWTRRQLAVLFDYIVKVGLLRVGRFNKIGYDRTKWYTVTDPKILDEDDYVPERKTKTKRRAIARPPVCNAILADVKGSDANVRGSDADVKGSDADAKSIAPSRGTYTTTKQQLTTEKITEKEQLNMFASSLRSDVDGGKEPPSVNSNPLFLNDKTEEDSIPLPHTEGVNPPSVVGEETHSPSRSGVVSPIRSEGSSLERSAPLVRTPTPEDIARAFEEIFKEKPNKKSTINTVTHQERIAL